MNSITQAKEQVNSYDAGDLMDAHALAQCQLSWVASLIRQVIKNNKTGEASCNTELLEIAQYLSEMHANDHDVNREAYENEWKGLKH